MNSDLLLRLQKEQLEIAKKVISICDKHSLQYFLIGGTLLGAVRHKGFIPWDDDFDMAMPRADYERLIEYCKNELGDKYYFHSNETDPEYWLPFAKVRKNGTLFDEKSILTIETHKGIFIDIFPLDNILNPKNILLPLQSKVIYILSIIIFGKRGLVLESGISYKQKILIFFAKITRFISIKTIAKFQRYLMTWHNSCHTEHWINWGSYYGYKKETMPKEKYLPSKELMFEGHIFKVPNDYDYVLTKIFGDYMLLPPIEQRVGLHAVEVKFSENK